MTTLDELREEVAGVYEQRAGNPRVHPNGFIQLDLDKVADDWAASHKQGHSGGMRRLHIWNPPGVELPHQGTVNEIHDHVFDMHSEIIRGTLYQRCYEFVVGAHDLSELEIGNDYVQLYRAVYSGRSDSRLEALGVYGVTRLVNRYSVREGSTYTQPASTFHDTETRLGLVVTVMTKTAVKAKQAHVLVPRDTEPDNSYDRASAMDAEYLWDAIWASLS